MARVAFPLVLQSPSTGSALVGATATITQHVVGGTLGTGPAGTIYTAETGSSAVSGNQIVTDDTGRWTQGSSSGYAQYWLPQGTYDIQISSTGLTTYTITRELFSASQSDEVALIGEPKFWPCVLVPAAFVRYDGSALSRTTYSALFNALTLQTTGSTTATSPTVTGVPSGALTTLNSLTGGATSGFAIPISGPAIASGTTVIAFSSGAGTLTLSKNAGSASTGGTLVIAPHGVGDGSTTFNVPRMTGNVPMGQTTSGAGQVLGSTGGEATHLLSASESGVAAHVHVTEASSTNEAGANMTSADLGGGTLETASGTVIATDNNGEGVPNTNSLLYGNGGFNIGLVVADHEHAIPSLAVEANTAASAASGHNNLQPFIACPWIGRHGIQ